jgi:streptomycin 6-kinase
MKLHRTPEEWAKVDPKAVVGGSQAQAENVLKMALQDISRLASDRDRIERNRDMWKDQCNRQAQQLSETIR